MGIASDFKMLYHIAFAKVGGKTHRDRLEAFYAAQAEGYDDFRKRLLHGREEMMRSLPLPAGGTLLDMGGGTGSNLEALPGLTSLKRATVVDLCGPLLETAKKRTFQADMQFDEDGNPLPPNGNGGKKAGKLDGDENVVIIEAAASSEAALHTEPVDGAESGAVAVGTKVPKARPIVPKEQAEAA